MTNLDKTLFLLAVTHKTASLYLREKMAVGADARGLFYNRLKALRVVEESLVLNTCNRFEIYGVAPENIDIHRSLRALLSTFFDIPIATFSRKLYWLKGAEVVRHLFAVGAGLESQVVGETEILGQVKTAYSQACEYGTVGKTLNPIFQKSFQAAKWARTHTEIGNGKVSIGSVAVDLAQRIFGDLRDSHTLVIGAGDIAGRTLEALKDRGAGTLTVASRRYNRAKALAHQVGAAAVDFQDFPSLLPHCDILICGVTTVVPLLSRTDFEAILEQRPDQPLFVIDLAVPRNIDPDAAQLQNVYLYNLDDLTSIARSNLKNRQDAAEHCRRDLYPKAENVWKQVAHSLLLNSQFGNLPFTPRQDATTISL